MKRFLLITLLSYPLFLIAQINRNSYIIHGNIKGLIEGEKITLKLFELGWKNKHLDSTYVKNGTFILKGTLEKSPRLVHFSFDKHPNKVCATLIDNDSIEITGSDINKLPYGFIQDFLTFSGSTSANDWKALINIDRIYSFYVGNTEQYLNMIKDSIGYNSQIIKNTIENKENFLRSLYGTLSMAMISKNTAIPLLLNSINQNTNSLHEYFIKDLYNKLDSDSKQSYYGVWLQQFSNLCNSEIFPFTELMSAEGKKININDILNNCKAVIINFWASNSSELDENQQELKQIYNKYAGTGLKIVGISSDTSEKKWKIASQDMPWLQVSDLKGDEGVVGKVYMEYGNTKSPNLTNVLLDKNGKIIGWNLKGSELLWAINNIFQN